jgi:hypothetical protein
LVFFLGNTSVNRSIELTNPVNSVDASEQSPLPYALEGPARSRGRSTSMLDCRSLASATQTYTDEWHVECVDYTKQFRQLTDRSVQLDSEGYPHIAYGGKHLYYARYDGQTWHYDVVDESPDVGIQASLALDGLDHPHISYFGQPDRVLKYAWNDGATWHVEAIGSASWYHSLALDEAGHPHISYYESDTNSLTYTSFDGTGWYSETVDSCGGEWNSLVLDSAGHPHISYRGGEYLDLMYAWYDGAEWQSKVVDYYTCSDMSLALDEMDQPHISYVHDHNLKHAWRNGVDWQTETLDSSFSSAPSLALDGLGRPHISYSLDHDEIVKYAWHDGADWHTERVGQAGNRDYCLSSSLALDEAGQPHIGFQGEHCDLVYAQRDGTEWQMETVDECSTVGPVTSLAVGRLDQPQVGYERRGIRYAWEDEGAWHIALVDGADGGDVTLALDGADQPHLAYGRWVGGWVGGTLEHAWRDGGTWHVETVAEGGCEQCSFRYQSLAVDGSGQPYISYCIWLRGFNCEGLRYAWRDDGTWNTEVVESGNVGDYSSLAVDELGRPHISYFDSGYGDLKYARRDATGWHIEFVDRAGYTGLYTSLALDRMGRPHISYQGPEDGGLRHAWQDGGAWHIETVDGTGDEYSSLALDTMGRPHISYEGDGHLRYAWHNGTEWQIETVDPGEGQPSLGLDRLDQPHISYRSDGHLKHAWRLLPPLSLEKQASPSSGLRNEDALTYTLTLSGPGLPVQLWDPLPEVVQYITGGVTGTVDPPAVYSPTVHAVTWAGTLPTDAVTTIHFQVTPHITGSVPLSLTPPIVNTAWLTDAQYGRNISATVIVNARRVYLPLVQRHIP